MKIEITEAIVDEEYLESDDFKEHCRQMDEAVAEEESYRKANQAKRRAEEALQQAPF